MKIYGLFIGIDRFADTKIRELTGCQRDALALWSLFKDTLPEIESSLLVDHQATSVAVRDSLNAILSQAGSEDIVIISFSSHGTRDHRLVLYDTSLTDLPGSTIPMDDVATAFKASRARAVVCILDCCFSGGAPARVLEESPAPRSPTTPLDSIAGAGRILISASGINEPALELNRHGLLTFALIEGLQAITETVSLPSLMDQVIHRVQAEAARQGHGQNPVLLGYVEGGLVLPSLRRGIEFFKAFPESKGLRISNRICDLAGFGLPADLLSIWESMFADGLNDLQLKAVNDGRILDGKSLFVVAPTSSGKTFIGELAAARAITERRKAVFLFPYRALVNEKYDAFLQIYGETLGMRVIRCTGDYLDQTDSFVRGKYDLAVLTYEMFLSLSVSIPATLDMIGLIVVDEVQFIADRTRGISVELLLTNVLAARERGLSPQILTLSAVIGGVNGFDEWLGAEKLIQTERPVPLIEGVLDRTGTLQFLDVAGVSKAEQLLPSHTVVQRGKDASSQDVIVPLIKKLLADNDQERVIIFRNNRGAPEGCALYLARDLGLPPANEALGLLPTTDLSTSSEALKKCLAGGTAFHTSNLGRGERVVIERAYRKRDGTVKVLAATTTVAAGINTPASTVILAEHQFFEADSTRPFTIAEYKNMAGRAGRLGYHETGRSIMLASTPHERMNLFQHYVLGKPEQLRSSFDPAHVETWLLRLLSQVKRVPRNATIKLLASTYGGYITAKVDPSWHDRTVAQLSDLLARMIKLGLVEEDGEFVRLTLLGHACGRSSLSFSSAMRLVEILRSRAGSKLMAEHLMILLQGMSELDGISTPLMRRGQAEGRWPTEVQRHFGHEIAHALQSRANDMFAYYARCKRVMVLHSWISGTPIQVIEQQSTTNAWQGKIGAGHVRQFADATRFHLHSAAKIAEVLLLGNAPDEKATDVLLRQLETGLPADALGLLDLPAVLERGIYLTLMSAGIKTKNALTSFDHNQLVELIGAQHAQEIMEGAQA